MVKFKFWESNAGRVFETPGLKGDNAQLEEEEGNSKNDLDIIWFHHRIKNNHQKRKIFYCDALPEKSGLVNKYKLKLSLYQWKNDLAYMKKSIILHIQLKFTRLTIFFVFTVTSSYTLMLKKGNSKLGTYCISFPFFRFLDTKVRKFQILT